MHASPARISRHNSLTCSWAQSHVQVELGAAKLRSAEAQSHELIQWVLLDATVVLRVLFSIMNVTTDVWWRDLPWTASFVPSLGSNVGQGLLLPSYRWEHCASYRFSGQPWFPQLLLPGPILCSCVSHEASLKYLANSINLAAESLFFFLSDQNSRFYKLKAQRESTSLRSLWAQKAGTSQHLALQTPSRARSPWDTSLLACFHSALKR